MRQAYVYELTFIPENKKYIGVRITKSGHAIDDLWKKYFSSSKVVKSLIDVYGICNDIWSVKILSEHDSFTDAIIEENKVLHGITNKNDYLNINFSAGSSAHLKNHLHYKISHVDDMKKSIYWPKALPIPRGYVKFYKSKPPQRKGVLLWINLKTGEQRFSKEELTEEGFVLKKDHIKQQKIAKTVIRESTCKRVWITNGIENKCLFISKSLGKYVAPNGWRVGKTTKHFKRICCNNGKENMYVQSCGDIPEGYAIGSCQTGTKSTLGKICITNGLTNAYINIDEELPKGWRFGSCSNGKRGKKKVINRNTGIQQFISHGELDFERHVLVVPDKKITHQSISTKLSSVWQNRKTDTKRIQLIEKIKSIIDLKHAAFPKGWHTYTTENLEKLIDATNIKD